MSRSLEGTESMSQSPFLLDYTARFDGYKIGDIPMRDTLIEGLTCPVNPLPHGRGSREYPGAMGDKP